MRRLFIILALLASVGCQSTPAPSATSTPVAKDSPSGESTPDSQAVVDEDTVRLRKTTIKTRRGQKWEMEAEEVDWMDDRSQAKAKVVTWWLIDENDKKWVKVDSPRADVDMDAEVVTFIGQTTATRIGFDETLHVQRLVYKGKERKFYGSGGVTWHRETVDLAAQTLTATAELDRVQLKGKVKGKTTGGFKGFEEPRKADSTGEN